MIWRGKGRAASVPSVQLDRMKAAAENFPALRSAHHMILIQANAPMDRSTSRYRHDQRVHIATGTHLHTVALNGEIRHPMQPPSELFMPLLHIFSDFLWFSLSSESPLICFNVFSHNSANTSPPPY